MTPDVEFFLFVLAPILLLIISLKSMIGANYEEKWSMRLIRYFVSFSGTFLLILLCVISLVTIDAEAYAIVPLTAIVATVVAFFYHILLS